MDNFLRFIFGLFLLLTACGKSPNKDDILKRGQTLYAKYGCAVCHSLDGTEIYGPALNEIYLKKIKVMRQGQEKAVIADRDYLIKAIADPGFEKVADYQNKDMPKTYFSKEDVELLADYIIAINQRKTKE